MTKLSLAIVFVVAWGVTSMAQVQQPSVTGPRPVKRAMTPFFTQEIFSANYESDSVVFEHPSKPSSMRVIKPRARRTGPIVKTAQKKTAQQPTVTVRTENVAVKPAVEPSKSKPIFDIVPPPPGAE